MDAAIIGAELVHVARTLTLTGSNGLTGVTTISSGTLQLGNGGTTGGLTATSNVVDNGTLIINRANTSTLDRAVSGSGLIINRGTGLATLGGALTNGGVETEVGSGGVTLTGSLTTAGTSYAGSNPAALVDQGGTQITLAGGSVIATSASGAEDGVQLNGGTFTVTSGSLTATTSGVWARAGGVIQNSGTITGGDSSVYFSGSGSQSLTVSGGGIYTGNGYRGIYAHADTGNVVLGTATSSLGTVSGALGGIDAATTSGVLDIVAGGTVSAASGNAILATSTSGRISINAAGTLTAGGAGNAAIYLSGNNGGNAITIGSDGGTPAVAQGWIGLRLAGTGTTTLTNYGTISATGGGANAVEIDAGTLVVGEQAGTITGNIAITAADTALTVNRSTNLALSNTITGSGTLNKSGTGLLTLTGVNSDANGQFSGVANVNAGILSINGTFGNTTFNNAYINVGSGGTLHGSGTIAGSVGVLNGGTVSAGNSPGTLTVNGNYMLASGATSLFELGTPNIAGGAGNDLINVGGNLTLGGTLSLVSAADVAASPVTGAYRLYNYGGALSGSFDGITTPTAQSATVYTSIPGQVNVLITNVGQYVQYWDGTDTTGAVPGPQGGAGVWSETGTNWTGSPTATVNAPWASGVGIFTGPADTVTISGTHDVQGLQFTADGYNLTGSGSLNLTGDPFSTPDQSFINVDDGVGATISTALTSTNGAIGLNKIGAGTLTLSGANSYTGKTSVTAGTLVLAQPGSLASDVTVGVDGTFDNAGTVAGAVTSSGITTNSGTIGGLVTTLAGTTTNSGVLNSGAMVVGGTLALSSGSVVNGAVQNSATITGQGQINGAVSNATGASFTLNGLLTGITRFTNDGTLTLAGNDLSLGMLDSSGITGVVQNGAATDATLTVGTDGSSGAYAGTLRDGTGGGRLLLVKVGDGTLTLSGANNYTGGTLVAGGALKAGAVDSLSPASAVTVARGATLDLAGYDQTIGSLAGDGAVTLGAATLSAGADNSSTSFTGIISGAGNLTKIGGGTLTLSGANSYTGETTVTAGYLVVIGQVAGPVINEAITTNAGTIAGSLTNTGEASNSGTIEGEVSNGGTLVSTGLLAGGLVNSGTASISGQIKGAVTNSGMLTITVPTSMPTVLTNNGVTDLGSTALTVGSLAGTVTAAVLQNGQLTTGGDNSSTTYAGTIADGATTTSLTKVGTGTLTLSGASTYTGNTTVSSGTLNLTGSLVSKVAVTQGAAFTGTGISGGLEIAGGGVLSPGGVDTISTLPTAGSVSFAAGSLYQVNASPNGSADRINASGPAILKGGTVQVTAGSGQYAVRTRYTILSAQGGVTGTFTDTTSNFAFLTPILSYDANDVYLTLARNDLDFGAAATTPNQFSVANAVQAGSVGSQLYDAVAVLSAAQARQAFDALSGEIHSSAVTAQFRTASTVRNAVLDRLHAAASSDDQSAGTSLWGQGFGTFGSIGGNGNTGRLVQQDSGFTLGLDTQVSPAWRLGIAGGYSDASLHVNARASTGSIESGYGALYAGGTYGALRLRLGGSYAWSVVDTHRSVGFSGFDAVQQNANYGATVGQAFGQIGYRLGSAHISIEPFVSGGTVHVERNRFAETGGASALAANGKNYNLQTSVVGAQGEGRLDTILGLHSPLSLRAMAGYQRTYGERMPATLLTLRDTGQSFGTTGAPIARNALVTQAGLGWRIAPGMSLSVDYTGQVGSDHTRDNGVKGSFSYRW
jgi:outer membrane autotransporter protein